jgi:hypothetical protein
MVSKSIGTTSIDLGLEALRLLIQRISEKCLDWNEAETRFQFMPLLNFEWVMLSFS